MEENNQRLIYEQLNQRSRLYTNQKWQVPFAYVGVLGLSLKEFPHEPNSLQGFALILLGAFSFAVFVHLSVLRYYELRAVKCMQEIEKKFYGTSISRGGDPWYLRFDSYIKVLTILSSFVLIWKGFQFIQDPYAKNVLTIFSLFALLILLGFIICKSHNCTRHLQEEVRKNNP